MQEPWPYLAHEVAGQPEEAAEYLARLPPPIVLRTMQGTQTALHDDEPSSTHIDHNAAISRQLDHGELDAAPIQLCLCKITALLFGRLDARPSYLAWRGHNDAKFHRQSRQQLRMFESCPVHGIRVYQQTGSALG